jgi:hypothetical protein
VIDLAPMGVLEVHLRGALDPTPRVSLLTAGAPGDEVIVDTLEATSPVWRLQHLAAGRYVLHADGVAPIPVVIEAGAAEVVIVDVPFCLPLRGTLLGEDGAPAAGWTLFVAPALLQPMDWLAGREPTKVTTDARGRFATQARPGRLRVVAGAPTDRTCVVERNLFLGEIEPGPDVTLRVPACVTLSLSRVVGSDGRAGRAALVGVGGEAFVELQAIATEVSCRVPPGPWILLLDGGLARTIVVPAAGLRMACDADQVDLTLRWRLPAELAPGARVPAHVSVIPTAMPRGNLRMLLEEEETFGLDVTVSAGLRTTLHLPPGPTVLVVRSRLGRVELAVDVAASGATEVEVALGH